MFSIFFGVLNFVIFILWKYEIIVLSRTQLILYLIIIISSFVYDIYQFFYNKYYIDNEDDDIFFDNAPNPLNPAPLPPTNEQVEFVEFMKKMEMEKEKILVRKNE